MFSVNLQNTTYQAEKSNAGSYVNQNRLNWDIQFIDDKKVHLIKGSRSIEAELVAIDLGTKSLQIRLGYMIATLELKDRFDLLLEKMGMASSGSGKLKEIKAPMPGLILDLKVKPGDQVKKGDVILILEAMKMENIIKSTGDGMVREVKVSLKQSVEKNQILIQF